MPTYRLPKLLFISLSACTLVATGCAGNASTDEASESNLTQATSAYTSLVDHDCRTLPSEGGDEMPFTQQVCSGMGGFDLVVEDSDERMNVEVMIGGKKHDLAVWSRLPAFSHLGEKAEWRGTFVAPGKVDPFALVFRYFQTDGTGHETSYLVVSRVTHDAACILDVVPSTDPNQNVRAREIADAARTTQCPGGPPPQPTSVFTSLRDPDCKTTVDNEEEGGQAHSVCPGVAGYTLYVAEGDIRQNVTVIHGTKESELFPIGGVINGGFSYVGDKADWRVHGPDQTPHAVIFRYFESEDDGVHAQTDHPYLFVAKVDGDRSCLVDIIDAKKHADANVLAHTSGDAAFSESCPSALPTIR